MTPHIRLPESIEPFDRSDPMEVPPAPLGTQLVIIVAVIMTVCWGYLLVAIAMAVL